MSANPDLGVKLKRACPQEPEPVPFKQIEIDRASLEIFDKLGKGNFGEVYAGNHIPEDTFTFSCQQGYHNRYRVCMYVTRSFAISPRLSLRFC